MPGRRTDKALRQVVAELADASSADISAVLDELDPVQRRRISVLLAEFAGIDAPSGAGEASPQVVSRLSPCLRLRFERGPEKKLSDAAWSAFKEAVESMRADELPGIAQSENDPTAWFRRFMSKSPAMGRAS